jgi:ornithine cyclodeaminase
MDTRIDFLYLDEQDMIKAGVTDMAACVEVMEEMFGLLGQGDYMMGGPNLNSHGIALYFPDEPKFPNMPKNGPDRRFMAMPAYLGGSFNIVGMKWYGSNIENHKQGLPRSILMVMLNDKDTGAPIALMSANLLSAYRTGAVPGVGAKYLARKGAKVAAIIGPGVMGRTVLESYVCACPEIDTVQILGRSKAGIDAFVAYTREKFPKITHIKVVDSLEAAVRGADLINIATTNPQHIEDHPFIDEKWIKPGAFFSLPGCTIMDDDFLIHRATKVTDNWKLYEAWGEEEEHPAYNAVPIHGVHWVDMIHEGKITREDVKDFGEILAGKLPARQSEDEIILMSIGGMPVEDLAWGLTVYRRALAQNIGVKLNLWDAPSLV